jgi:RNA polymerase sigma-70 factor (ECF subfamily)
LNINLSSWLAALHSSGAARDAALSRLHEMLLRLATHEAHRREPSGREMRDEGQSPVRDARPSFVRRLGVWHLNEHDGDGDEALEDRWRD